MVGILSQLLNKVRVTKNIKRDIVKKYPRNTISSVGFNINKVIEGRI